MKRIFLGKPLHWLVLAVIIVIMWWMGSALLQTRNFHLFLVILLALASGAVGVVIATTRPGEQVTREPFEDD